MTARGSFVGRTFTDVKEKCVAGRLHPMLLFFEREKRSKTPPRFKGDRKEEKKEAEKKEVEKPPARRWRRRRWRVRRPPLKPDF